MSHENVIDPVVAYYEEKLAQFGGTAQGVDWKDQHSQLLRFEQLLRALGIEQAAHPFSIVDYGCGYGALLPFLTARGLTFTYTGYDRSPRMIEEARRLHPPGGAAAFTTNWDAVPPSDYVVASGVFNVRLDAGEKEWHSSVLQCLGAIHGKATAGWAANFLTSWSDRDRMRADLYYADPAVLFDWCKQRSRWVSLLHDYGLYEFTLGVRRQPRRG
jgi:SAM-dependent methyltransferase